MSLLQLKFYLDNEESPIIASTVANGNSSFRVGILLDMKQPGWWNIAALTCRVNTVGDGPRVGHNAWAVADNVADVPADVPRRVGFALLGPNGRFRLMELQSNIALRPAHEFASAADEVRTKDVVETTSCIHGRPRQDLVGGHPPLRLEKRHHTSSAGEAKAWAPNFANLGRSAGSVRILDASTLEDIGFEGIHDGLGAPGGWDPSGQGGSRLHLGGRYGGGNGVYLDKRSWAKDIRSLHGRPVNSRLGHNKDGGGGYR
ncbi:hypothetical protein NM208_g12965 [Fusarium decemcellulare]|uniref:Uncharacterized protein n=1 Tax=Fusarium decemcellulare TaxID=57161 RepID=A0ACC1RLL9_9HYPO|nr:hypothetical protein NM208_g12965 [Fusarium decemcellulare]